MKKQSVRNATIILGALGAFGLSGCGDSVTKASVAADGVKEIAIKVAPGSSSQIHACNDPCLHGNF